MGGIKRYAIFAYSDHYPRGGWNDHLASYDSLCEAEERVELERMGDGGCYENYDIVDLYGR